MKTRGFLRPMLKSLEIRRRSGVHYGVSNDESLLPPIARSRRSRNKHRRKQRQNGGSSDDELEGKHFVIRILNFYMCGIRVNN